MIDDLPGQILDLIFCIFLIIVISVLFWLIVDKNNNNNNIKKTSENSLEPVKTWTQTMTQAWMWNTGVYLLAHLYYNLQSSRTGFIPQSQMTKERKRKIPVTHTPWRTQSRVCNFKAEVNGYKCTYVWFVIQLQNILGGAKSLNSLLKSIYNYAVTLKETLQSSAAQWCALNVFFLLWPPDGAIHV